jgi:serine phosphatase RsbU (regulator of sigma subunit)
LHTTKDASSLGSGETLVAFTDGVSESMNAQFEEWGEERLVGELHAS